MKTRNYVMITLLVVAFSFIGCNKEESNYSGKMTIEDVTTSNKMDAISNDVSEIAEDQLDQQSTAKMNHISILPDCATVSTTVNGNTWTRVIDFGTTGCQYHSGAILKGQIIISGSTNFNQSPYVWTYNFNNFSYNGILVQGTKTLSRTVQATTALSTPHPVVIIDLDLNFTFPNGNTYVRTGTRTRELIEGHDTPHIFIDNVYLVSGNWTTTGMNFPQVTIISTPLRIEISCDYKLVLGVITITRNTHNAVLNYGSGTCDNNATISIDGGTPYALTFGN